MAKMRANLLQCEKFRNIWKFLRIHRHICATDRCGGGGGGISGFDREMGGGGGGGGKSFWGPFNVFPRSFRVLLVHFGSFWVLYASFLGHFGFFMRPFGVLLGSFWDPFAYFVRTLCVLLGPFGSIWVISRTALKVVLLLFCQL